MKNKIFLLGLISLFCFLDVAAQGGSAFGIKVGPSIGFQNWGRSGSSSLLARYHGMAYIETFSPDAEYALFAQAGYHVRGGALRLRSGSFTNQNGSIFTRRATSFPYEFNNLALSLGAKQRFLTDAVTYYWLLGIRGEFTVSTNLEDYHPENDPFARFNSIHPFPGTAVRKINYGVIVGGGLEFMFSELVGGLLELSVSPDFSNQYMFGSVPFSDLNGNQQFTGEREIKNISIELSLGIRLLRIVEYVNKIY